MTDEAIKAISSDICITVMVLGIMLCVLIYKLKKLDTRRDNEDDDE